MTACGSDNMEYTNAEVTEVTKLYEPANEKAINLTSSGSLYFSWEPALAQDGGAPLYEVYFDKAGGDFSSPIYILASDLNGYSSGADISHKILNKIAGLAGAQPGETITLAWAVASSRGINQKVSKVSNSITVTRIEGLEDPGQVYITGDGSEAGSDLSNALAMHRSGDGEYEVYVKLVSGGTYKFVDSKSGSPVEYYIADGKLREGSEGTANTLDGVYRIKIDFGAASASTPIEITEVGYWFCPNNTIEWKLAYQGKGIWKGTGPVNFKQESWGGDERYKFRVTLKDSKGTESQEDWGPANAGEDGKPSGTASYYNLAIYTSVSQWDHKWKFANDFDGKTVTLTVKMTGDTYTHEVSL
ncbi:hypothetical protein FACS1894179_05770 [Bacteroidia bacterium]|nr:hypothetical protein FACS1894179_05770 [Bacteroidia bacterium]